MRFLVLTFIVVGLALGFANAADVHSRQKRGIASFFKRIWPLRKNKGSNDGADQMMEASASMPVAATAMYPYTDYANYQQMFNQQLYAQNPDFVNQALANFQQQQQQQQQQQESQFSYNPEQYQQQQQSSQYQPQDQQQQQQQQMSMMAPTSQQQDGQDNVVPDQSQQSGYNMEESAPHASVYNGQQGGQGYGHGDRNQFHARPYGNSPGTIDVHQVLDQFIRQAGLSQSGDHDSGNRDHMFSESKPVFSVKKLYSYPFYASTSGNKPTSHGAFGRR